MDNSRLRHPATSLAVILAGLTGFALVSSGWTTRYTVSGGLKSSARPSQVGCGLGSIPGRYVTGISANHFEEVWGMVRTAQDHLSVNWSIVVYDLVGDLSSAQIADIKSWCGVEYRRMVIPGFLPRYRSVILLVQKIGYARPGQ